MHFTVAANDMQRDLLFPELLRKAFSEGIDTSFEFIPSGVPSASLLRDARCDLILTPAPPDAPDLLQRKLFSASMMCFYDETQTGPPSTIDDYLSA